MSMMAGRGWSPNEDALHVSHIDWSDVARRFRVNRLKPLVRGRLASALDKLSACIKYKVISAVRIEPSLHSYEGGETSYGTVDSPVISTSSTAISKGINSTLSKSFPFHTFIIALAHLFSCFLALCNLCVPVSFFAILKFF